MAPLTAYRDADVDLSILEGKTISVIGYGSQGRAQSRMLHESGLNVCVGLRENGPSWKQALEDGLAAFSIAEAAEKAAIIHLLIPDETQKSVYDAHIQPYLSPGKILSFSHGFNIVFKRIVPPAGVGVIMVAPYAPGVEAYRLYKEGSGVPALIAVHQDTSDHKGRALALALAKAMRFTKAGVLEGTFAQETHQDLFGEQVVLCGGVPSLMKAALETLIDAGYPPELAYLECIKQMKLIVNLIDQGGFAAMYEKISNTAEYGAQTRGPRLINAETKRTMKQILNEIEDGRFAREWIEETEKHLMENLLEMRRKESEHPAELARLAIEKLFKTKPTPS
jgi:ketol-acid reductoisomerase